MTGTVFLMKEFNSDQVTRYFNLPEEYRIERAAMNFMFRTMREEVPPKSPEDLKDLASLTIEKIELRYNIFKEFGEDFFFGSPYDGEALITAVICDEYVNHINDPYPEEFKRDADVIDEPVRFRNDGIEEPVVSRACNIWDDATMLHQNGQPSDPADLPCAEAVFLAHVNVFQHIYEINQKLGELDEDELEEIVTSDIPKGRAILRMDTELGRHVSKYFDYIEQELSPHLPAYLKQQLSGNSMPPPRAKPLLSIVPKPEVL